MSWITDLYGKITGMKNNTNQQDLMNKINDTYESISKGIEDLNAKVNSVKELKQKLKNLPPPPEKPKELSSDKTNKEVEKTDKVPPPAPIPAAPEPAAPMPAATTSSSSTESNTNMGAPAPAPAPAPEPFLQKPQDTSLSSPLPRPGATDATSLDNLGSTDFDGGKKRKTRAKLNRTIHKNINKGERKKRQRTRKNKNSSASASVSASASEAAV